MWKFFRKIFVLLLLVACTGNKVEYLVEADRLLLTNPDSAYAVLAAHEPELDRQDKATQMKHRLLMADAQNKCFRQMPSEEEFEPVVNYYDRRGTNNERMRAYYLHGRICHDKEEVADAVLSYERAMEIADTTKKDCDYNTLFRVYGQMASLYNQYNMPEDGLRAWEKYSYYAQKAGDTYNYIRGIELKLDSYYLLGDTLQIISQTKKAHDLYEQNGYGQSAATVYPTLIYIYLKQGKYEEANRLMQIFENESGLFADGEITQGHGFYYQSKGLYYQGIHKNDSAEYFFRKLLQCGPKYEAYNGLLSVYGYANKIDSIKKYSELQDIAIEEMLREQQADNYHKINTLHKYSNYKKIALVETQKTHTRERIIIVLVAAAVLLSFIGYRRFRHYQKDKVLEINQITDKYVRAKLKCEVLNEDLSVLKGIKTVNEKMIENRQQQIADLSTKIGKYKERLQSLKTNEKFQALKECRIVEYFDEKKLHTLNFSTPSENEWRQLKEAFSLHMPLFMTTLTENDALSERELRVCLLESLGFSPGEIAVVLDTTSQIVTNAKASANQKLFSQKKASTLRKNLRKNFMM